jgi:phage FluMu protein Com
MAAVNLRCKQCGTLMAVDEAASGKEVACPRCLELMERVAGETAEPLPEAAVPSLPAANGSKDEEESIFAGAEDSLFDHVEESKVELPDSPAGTQGSALTPPAEAQVSDQPPPTAEPAPAAVAEAQEPAPSTSCANYEPAAPAPAPPALEASWAAPAPPSDALALGEETAGTGLALSILQDAESPQLAVAEPGTDLTPPSFTAKVPRLALTSGMGRTMFLALVLLPLISYAILATIAILILYLRQPPDPFEALPDLEGDLKGAKHQKQSSITYERIPPEAKLPEKLRVSLGSTLRIGDVAVSPEKVQLKRLRIRHPGFAPELQDEASLVLQVRLKNTSRDVEFSPTDPYFDRQWKPDQANKPYTFLELGGDRFFGGPLFWQPGVPPEGRERVEGQVYKVLAPGQELTTLVCTDPEIRIAEVLNRYQGNLLWRIQLRRGLVAVRNREVSATAVVGVQFKHSDIEPES